MEAIIEDFINKILDLLVKCMKEGIPELGIPSLDPINIPGKKEIEISTFFANIRGNFREFNVSGLAAMGVPKVSLKDKKVTATNTAKVAIGGKYTLNGRAMKLFTIDSDSTFKCIIDALKVTIGLSYQDTKNLKAIVELKSGSIKLELEDFEHAKKASALLDKIAGLVAKFVEESLAPTMQSAVQKLIDQHKGDIPG